MRQLLVIYALISSLNLSCRTFDKKTEVADESDLVAAAQQELSEQNTNFEKSVELVKSENISFKAEFSNFKLALAEYKASASYQNPQNEDDRVFHDLAAASDLLTQERVQKLIQEKRFSLAAERAQNNLSEIESRVKEIFAPKEKNDSPNLNLALEKERSSPAVFNSAVLFASMGAVGLLYSAKTASLGFNPATSVAAGAFTLGLFLMAPIVPDKIRAKKAQGLIASGAVASGLFALGFVVFGTSQWAEEKRLFGRGEIAGQNIENAKIQKIGSIYIATLAGLLSAGLAVWADTLNLASVLSPKDIVASKVGRAFVAFEKLETQWLD